MKDKKFLIIIILALILVGLIIAYAKKNSGSTSYENYGSYQTSRSTDTSTSSETNESKITLKQNSEVKSALVENIEPHATYYLEEVYVEKNQAVAKGANILKYTNGTYLTAPYDCSITELNLPATGGKLLNSHYVQVSSNNVLAVTMNVDESNIGKVNIGQEATVSLTTIEKEYKGYVTNISSTASNGKFKVTIEFENDGNVKLGMTSSIEMEV